MSKIEELIKQYCPNGVKKARLGELGTFDNIGVDKKSLPNEKPVVLLNYMDVYKHKYIDSNIPQMVVTASNRKIETCTVEKGDIFITPTSETIDDIGHSAMITETIHNAVYSYHIMRYRLFDRNDTTCRYINYLFESDVIQKQIAKSAQGLTRFGVSKNKFADMQIPLPPLPIQEKIAEVLDKFSLLTAELEAELDLQKKRYDYYRNRILSFDSEPSSNSVQWRPLGEVGTFERGNGMSKNDFSDEGIGCIHYGQIYTKLNTFTYNTLTKVPFQLAQKLTKVETGNLVIACTSENVEDVCKSVAWLGNETIVIGGHSAVYRHKMNPKYVAYYFQTKKFAEQKRKYAKGVKVIDIKISELEKILIPVPPIEVQDFIANILDRFEALVTNLSNGLPAEIERVRKQYEYYRNKLLTFPIAEQ